MSLPLRHELGFEKKLEEKRTAPTWVYSDWYCPACGERDMWQEGDGGGDYYHDSTVTCHSCQHQMCCVSRVDRRKKFRLKSDGHGPTAG